MSSSALSISPSLLDKKHSRDGPWPATNFSALEHLHPRASFTTISSASHNLSPYPHLASDFNSPNNNVSTPADSLSAISEQYPPSDFSDSLDPFFGVDFDDVEGGTPSFLSDPAVSIGGSSERSESRSHIVHPTPARNPDSPGPDPHHYSQTSTASDELKCFRPHGRASAECLSHALSDGGRNFPNEFALNQFASQSRSGTSEPISSEEHPASNTAPMPSPSPGVTVSMWGRDQVDETFPFCSDTEGPATVRADGTSADDNLEPVTYQRAPTASDYHESRRHPSVASRGGWGPESRPTTQGASINELDAKRKVVERNREVDRWMSAHESGGSPEEPSSPLASLAVEYDGLGASEISLGNETENKPLPGQTYYTEGSGPLTDEDWKLMRQHQAWADAPAVFRINNTERTQPETAQAAMQRFDQMCQDTGSVLSRSATWGTRRRSLPSIADIEGVTSGNFLKKLTINRERKPSLIFKELRGLMRKPSTTQLLKRHQTDEDIKVEEPHGRRESRDTLAPPVGRTSSWTKKTPVPSLNTALVSMATGAAAIGTTHARTSSISNAPSPKSPFFKNVRRPRSRSELPKACIEESPSSLAGMWRQAGGPPVAQLARGSSAPEVDEHEDDEHEDEEDDPYEDQVHATAGATDIIDNLEPNLAGFRQQVLQMNPRLAEQNTYLVDRIAHQQVVRYKDLLNKRIKHIQHVNAADCPSGRMCIDSGGLATPFDVKGESQGTDPLVTTYNERSDGDGMPVEGAITVECFPPDIPVPPTKSLPAEFECQLCYSTKRFAKPSDWTKHVHEDISPFTCTWDRCREPKIFKRKADWVRHENEGHRHLEWWTCDICAHTCFRRDNFLQHLVREHKYPEPKVKTKAAVKKAGAQDTTWKLVEKCRAETHRKPQDEPCRFCGKTLTSWKKLTVHLAKHMETMSLPVLRLVASKDLDADTIISPVQEPPPRNFPPVKPGPVHAPALPLSPSGLAHPGSANPSYTHYPNAFLNFYDSPMQGLQQSGCLSIGLRQPEVTSSFLSQTGYPNLSVTPGAYMGANQFNTMAQQLEPLPAYSNPLGLQTATGNQLLDSTPLYSSSFGGDQQQYSHQGSASPYSHAPHQGFHHQQ